MWICKHCNNNYNFQRTTEKANHSRHCDGNPKKQESYKRNKQLASCRIDNKLGKYLPFTVQCFACTKEFDVKERELQFPSKQQYFCSRSCANSVGGKAKAEKHHSDDVARYRTVAWRHHERKCLVCFEENVVAVHHVNENHKDNRPENLVPLCPTHHQYMHSRYKHLICEKVDKYVKEKWG
jgi:hypothetical protein